MWIWVFVIILKTMILQEVKAKGQDLHKLNEYVAIQINDTHPTMVIPELIRILTEQEGFRMEEAIDVLVDSRYDEVVELIDKKEFIANPPDAYENKIFCKGEPLKTGVIWNKKYIEEEK